jgi:hypothetical protein
MHTQAQYEQRDDCPVDDGVVFPSGVGWDDYERLLEMRGGHSAPRTAYLEGEFEVMSPSRTHEGIKSTIGRLVEIDCMEHDLELSS